MMLIWLLLSFFAFNTCKSATEIFHPTLRLTVPSNVSVLRLYNGFVAIGSPSADIDEFQDVGSVKVFSTTNGRNQGPPCCRSRIGNENIGDNLGYSIALSKNDVVVGSIHGSGQQSNDTHGVVFVHKYNTQNPSITPKIYADDGMPHDEFGASVGILDDTIVVGARYHSSAGNKSGAAYVFVRNGATWQQSQKLIPTQLSSNEMMGSCVAITPKYIALGGNKVVYIFKKNNYLGVWEEQKKPLQPPHLNTSSIRSNIDMFEGRIGGKVQSRIVIGVDSSEQEGKVYVYIRQYGSWNLEAVLTASDGIVGNKFGGTVAIDHRTIVVGAYQGSDSELGRAYVFERIQGNWTEVAKLVGQTNDTDLYYGASVDVYNGVVAVTGSENNGKSRVDLYDIFENFVVTCTENNMMGIWRLSQFPGDLTFALNDQQCNNFTGVNTTHVWVMTGLNECKTQGKQEADYVVFTNTATFSMTIKMKDPNSGVGVQYESRQEFDMVCRFETTGESLHLVTPFQSTEVREIIVVPLPVPVPTINITGNATVNVTATPPIGEFNGTMDMYTNKFFFEKAFHPMFVTSGEPVYIGIKDRFDNQNFKFTVDRCMAKITNGGDLTGELTILYRMCPMYEDIWTQHVENGTHFLFQFDTFDFIQYSLNMTFECHLYVCLKASMGHGCVQHCDNPTAGQRATRSDESEGTPFQELILTTEMIDFKRKNTCEDITCPENSVCLATYPATCRCNDGYVKNMITGNCTDAVTEGTATRVTNLALEKPYVPSYNDTSSDEFRALAREVEEHLTYYIAEYIEESNDPSIIGIKVIGAKPGSIILDVDILRSSPAVTTNQVIGALVGALMSAPTTAPTVSTNATANATSTANVTAAPVIKPFILPVAKPLYLGISVVIQQDRIPFVAAATTTAEPVTTTAEPTTTSKPPTTISSTTGTTSESTTSASPMTVTAPKSSTSVNTNATDTVVSSPKSTATTALTTSSTVTTAPVGEQGGIDDENAKIITAAVVPSLALIIICFIVFAVYVHRSQIRAQFSWDLMDT